jgi:hypothetical protein
VIRASSSIALVVALVACGPTVPHPPYVEQASAALTAIALPPPPGRIERVPPRPPTADAWVDGEWVLAHDRWLWLLGRWVHVAPGAKYAPWVTVRGVDGTLYYAPSIWVNAHGTQIDPPPPLVVATASGEAVFAAGGEVEKTGRNISTPPASHIADGGVVDAAPDAP